MFHLEARSKAAASSQPFREGTHGPVGPQFLVMLLETLIGAPAHALGLLRKAGSVKRTTPGAPETLRDLVGTIERPLIIGLALRTIGEAVAAPAK
jgi:hypothetical protein